MQVLSSLSGFPFYAPSAGFAPTNSADVSAIASSYAESAASGKLDATASSQFLTSVPSDYATTAYVDSSISGFAYESAVSGWTAKQDALTFGYDTSDKISSINGSSLAGGEGGGMVTALGTGVDPWYQTSVSSINGMGLFARWADSANNAGTANSAKSAYSSEHADIANYAKTVAPSALSSYMTAVSSPSGTVRISFGTAIDCTDSAVVGSYVAGSSGILTGSDLLIKPSSDVPMNIYSGLLPQEYTAQFLFEYGDACTVYLSGNNGESAEIWYNGSPTSIIVPIHSAIAVAAYTENTWIVSARMYYTADTVDNSHVVQLAHASALPTYQYDAEDKISSINGSAIAGGAGGGVDSATVSAIASSYAESAASSKLDTTAFNSGDFYSTSNPSGFIDSAYVDSAVSGKADASALSGYYTTANESGFITGVDLTDYATTAYVDSAVSSKADSSALSSYVPYSSLEYNTASAISGINGSALAAGSTYSAGEGIDITDDVISVETPVDIVAGPGIVIDNPDGNTLRVSQSTFGAWQDISNQFTWASNVSDNHITCLYNSSLKLLYLQGYAQINVGTSNTQIGTLPNNLKTIAKVVEVGTPSTLEEKHGVLSTNDARDTLMFKWITQPSNKYAGVLLITPVEEI